MVALAGVVLASDGSSAVATSPTVTVLIKGARPMCSVDGHRARRCARSYRVRVGHQLTVRQHARRSTIAVAGRGPLCSIGRHPAHACRRRYRLHAGQVLTVRARAGHTRKPPPSRVPPAGGTSAPTPPVPAQADDGCPAMPNGNLDSGGHSWTLEGQDDFTKAAPVGAFASGGSNPVYTGDHGMGWSEYADGATSTYSNGSPGYEPSVVQSVHDGVLDWYLHNYNGHPVSANPSPFPGGHHYQQYGRYSFCEKLAPADAHRLDDFYQAIMVWPQSDGDYQSAESDFPEGKLSDTSFSAFAHYGGSGAQDAFDTPTMDTSQWHVYTQEWGPGFRNT